MPNLKTLRNDWRGFLRRSVPYMAMLGALGLSFIVLEQQRGILGLFPWIMLSLGILFFAWTIEDVRYYYAPLLLGVVASILMLLPYDHTDTSLFYISGITILVLVGLITSGRAHFVGSSLYHRLTLYQMMGSFPGGSILVYDTNLCYENAFGTAFADEGYVVDSLIGKTVHDLIGASPNYPLIVAAMHQSLLGKTTTLHLTGPEGHTYISTFVPSVDSAGLIVGGFTISQDVTDLERAQRDLVAAMDKMLVALCRALEYRDVDTEGHSHRVSEVTLALARAMNLPEDQLENVRKGSLLHDLGKIGVPDAILRKPGKLTEEEWSIMKQHPSYGRQILLPVEYLAGALTIVYMHHERYNGSGYPQGLVGDQIPLEARLFAVVDVWDALRSDRPYRKGWTDAAVFAHLQEQSGILFDPDVVTAFAYLHETGQLRHWPPYRSE